MKGMKKYYTQKIMWYLLTLVFAVLLNFILPRLMPGDPVSTIASKSVEGMTDATAIQKVYEDYAAKFGINKPMYVQFFTWVKNALRGDFGISFSQYPRTVSDIISSSVLWTICLQLPAIIVGWILGNLLGAIAAYMKGVFDKAILPAFLFISNVPAFGMATVLLFVFFTEITYCTCSRRLCEQYDSAYEPCFYEICAFTLPVAVLVYRNHHDRRPGYWYAFNVNL